MDSEEREELLHIQTPSVSQISHTSDKTLTFHCSTSMGSLSNSPSSRHSSVLPFIRTFVPPNAMKFFVLLALLATAVAAATDDGAAQTQRHILAAGDDSILLARRAFRAAEPADN